MRRIRSVGLYLGLFAASLAAPAFAEQIRAAAAPKPMTVSMQKHNAGTFYIAGALEGHGEMNFLVDTGSSYMVINETMLATLRKAGKAEPLREISGLMADGTRRIIPTYLLKNLRLGDACWIAEVEAAVIPGSTRPILGMDVLARLAPFTFSIDPAQLVLNACLAEPATRNAAAPTPDATVLAAPQASH